MHLKQFPIIVFFLLLYFSSKNYAQGWAWGKAATGGMCDAWGAATDRFGNVFGAGIVQGIGILDFGAGVTAPAGSSVVWVKYDNSGTPLWAGGAISISGTGGLWLNNITTDPFGNLIVFGSCGGAGSMQIGSFLLINSNPLGVPAYFLAKINPSGTVIWAIMEGECIPPTMSPVFIGAPIISTGSVTTDNVGNMYIVGGFRRPIMMIGSYTLTNSSSSGSFDVFVAKYTNTGALAWASSIGGSESDYGLGITVASTGNVYVCGSLQSPFMTIGSTTIANISVNGRAYIAEFSSAGVPQWGQASGGANGAFAVGLAHDNYGNIYMTGGFADTSISFGGTVVTRSYPAAAPQLALYLTKYSSSHAATWNKTIGSPRFGLWGLAIAMAPCGQVWVSANYSETANIDGTMFPVVTDGYTGPDPVLTVGYNLDGSIGGIAGLSSGGDDQNGIACDPNGNVFLCADNFRTIRSVIGPDTLPPHPLSVSEGFYLAKYAAIISDTINISTDTFFCNSDSITLTAPPGYTNYYWNNNSTDSTLTVSSGTYWVYGVTCGGATICDTFHVNKMSHDTTYNSTDTICAPLVGSIILCATPATSHEWYDGSTDSIHLVSIPGTYWAISVSPSGCNTIIDSFLIKEKFAIDIGKGDTVCPGIPAFIKIETNPPNVQPILHWMPSTNIVDTMKLNTSFQTSAPGIYRYLLIARNAFGCTSEDSVSFMVSNPIDIDISPGNITIPIGGSIQLNVQCFPVNQNGMSYYWMPNDGTLSNPNINNPIATPLKTTTYTVLGMNMHGCRDTATETIAVNYVDEGLPTAFTPNGDGLNDVFKLYNSKYAKLVDFSIYNRWGERVYHNIDDVSGGWDGTYNGVKQDAGVYFYIIIIARPDGTNKTLKGDVSLIR